MDERGIFVDPHKIMALSLKYLVEKRGLSGAVVRTVSTTRMIDRLAKRYGLKLYETPVGFNHIADYMMKESVLIGGEESGGISFLGHIPEGDGILMGLLVIEMIAKYGCSLADLVRRFRKTNTDWRTLPDKVAIQLNDTHPTLAVPELMRILLDEAHLGWDEAWDLTRRTLAYTNHTLLPEALEKWPLAWFEDMLPRHLEIIYEINRRLTDEVRNRFPGDEARVQRVSLIEEGAARKIRMANLAIVGSHSTNGVAAIHSQLLRTVTVKDLAEMFPKRFSNKTNGVTPRRWLLMSNPALSRTITDAIGDAWVTDLSELKKLKPLADNQASGQAFRKAKRDAKLSFVDWLKRTSGETVDPDSIFDCQIKRIHEYKRQLLNALRIVVLYNRLRENPDFKTAPRTFFFAGKAAPAYQLAKLIIKFINNLAEVVDEDPISRGRLKVLFLPDYCVSMAERLIPATDVSNQISTAGYEASGTSNMKFMMNGALTIGTRDGATIEMAEAEYRVHSRGLLTGIAFLVGPFVGGYLVGIAWYRWRAWQALRRYYTRKIARAERARLPG